MSMPQYIRVAVVSSNSETLRKITKGSKISEPGIAPRYSLVALSKPDGKRVIGLSDLECERVLLWIALDNKAREKCDELHLKNAKSKKYNRGFYNVHLPEPVIQVKSNSEFKKKVDDIYEAFCETS